MRSILIFIIFLSSIVSVSSQNRLYKVNDNYLLDTAGFTIMVGEKYNLDKYLKSDPQAYSFYEQYQKSKKRASVTGFLGAAGLVATGASSGRLIKVNNDPDRELLEGLGAAMFLWVGSIFAAVFGTSGLLLYRRSKREFRDAIDTYNLNQRKEIGLRPGLFYSGDVGVGIGFYVSF